MATDKEYKAVIDALSGECERLHKENEELKALSQEPTDENLHREREQAYMQGYEDASKRFRQEPCDDAISRKLAIRAIKNLYPDIPRVDFNGAKRKWADKYAQYIECERLIEQLPSVTQKSGKWKSTIDGKPICSECGFVSESEDGYFVSHYCPNCGARMFEPQESEDEE